MAKKSTATKKAATRRRYTRDKLLEQVHYYQLSVSSREIYLHSADESDEEPGVEYRMATKFIKNLHILDTQSAQNILVHMHTPGGAWNDGMAIFDSMRFARSPITILCYSQASSMSGIVLQAADQRVLMPNCEFMVHHGSLFVDNNSMAVKSAVDMNEYYCKIMLQVFAQRCVNGSYFKSKRYGVAKIAAFIDSKIREKSDWYMTAEDAVEFGFADGILGQHGFETIDKSRIRQKFDMS
jgi:ATP-dependent Clp protease, protease subunit